MEVRAGEEVDQQVLRRDQHGHWQGLLRYRRYYEGSGRWCRGHLDRVREPGHDPLGAEDFRWLASCLDHFMDKETGQEMEVVDQMAFLEWLAEHYRDFGAQLEFVSDRSSEGNQFVRGFGGVGAILRYRLNFEQLAELEDDDEFYDD